MTANRYESLKIFTDGASRGNPGHASLGLAISDAKGKVLVEHGEYLGQVTNNQAEYRAIIKALELASSLTDGRVDMFMDSELAVRQLTGRYKIKHPEIRERASEVLALTRRFKSVTFAHVPRERNKVADRLANEALDRHLNLGS